MVAIALIEDGMEPLDAVALIRSKRRGAINARQLHYLEHNYKRRGGGGGSGGGCIIM
jgi:protein tyrosine phosphatase type IVA